MINRNKEHFKANDPPTGIIESNKSVASVSNAVAIGDSISIITTHIDCGNVGVLETDLTKNSNMEIGKIQPLQIRRKVTKAAMESIRKIARMKKYLVIKKTDDDEFLAGLMSDISEKSIEVAAPTIPEADVDLFDDSLGNADIFEFSTSNNSTNTLFRKLL